MVDKIHISHGNIDGSTYICLSSKKPLAVTTKHYGVYDHQVDLLIKKRKTCRVPREVLAKSPWTDWFKKKSENL